MNKSKAGTIAQLQREMKDAELTQKACLEYIEHYREEYRKAYRTKWKCFHELKELEENA